MTLGTLPLLLTLAAASPASAPFPATLDAARCVPGFCVSPVRRGPPPGLMFLAMGFVVVGAAGLRGRATQGAAS